MCPKRNYIPKNVAESFLWTQRFAILDIHNFLGTYSSNILRRPYESTLFKLFELSTTLYPWRFFSWFGLKITCIYINNIQKLKIIEKKFMVSAELEDPTPLDFAQPKFGLSKIKEKKSSVLPTELSGPLLRRAPNLNIVQYLPKFH